MDAGSSSNRTMARASGLPVYLRALRAVRRPRPAYQASRCEVDSRKARPKETGMKPTNRLGYEDGFLMGLWLGGCLVIAVAVAAYYIGRLL